MFGCGFTTRRVWVLAPDRIARTICALKMIGRSFMPSPFVQSLRKRVSIPIENH